MLLATDFVISVCFWCPSTSFCHTSSLDWPGIYISKCVHDILQTLDWGLRVASEHEHSIEIAIEWKQAPLTTLDFTCVPALCHVSGNRGRSFLNTALLHSFMWVELWNSISYLQCLICLSAQPGVLNLTSQSFYIGGRLCAQTKFVMFHISAMPHLMVYFVQTNRQRQNSVKAFWQLIVPIAVELIRSSASPKNETMWASGANLSQLLQQILSCRNVLHETEKCSLSDYILHEGKLSDVSLSSLLVCQDARMSCSYSPGSSYTIGINSYMWQVMLLIYSLMSCVVCSKKQKSPLFERFLLRW